MMLFSRRVWLLARTRKSAWASSSLGPPLSSRSDSTDEPRTVSTSHAGKEGCESHEADGWGDLLRECAFSSRTSAFAQARRFKRRSAAGCREAIGGEPVLSSRAATLHCVAPTSENGLC